LRWEFTHTSPRATVRRFRSRKNVTSGVSIKTAALLAETIRSFSVGRGID
jgi:hypothetical protein